jgi:hypothetical protein
MKTLQLFLFAFTVIPLLKVGILSAQNCQYWSVPQPVSDSVTDNHNATMVMVSENPPVYYVFWERTFENIWSEIVCMNLYAPSEPQVIIHGNTFEFNNPQVIAVSDYTEPDTLAYVFYLDSYMEGYVDIFYQILTDTGFTGPGRFTNTILNESHLRVSPRGGMVWQEGDKIRFSRLNKDNSGFYFEPVITIDEGECRNPDIQNASMDFTEQFIAWEKGNPDNPEIWYSFWSPDNGGWGDPLLLFDDGSHFNIKFSSSLDPYTWVSILLSDQVDSMGQYHISGYDFYFQDEFVSDFSQSGALQPDFFSIDLITDRYWDMGYLAFIQDEEDNNSDIFSSDYGYLLPGFGSYCRVDSTSQPDVNPQLFQGAWHGNYFDLFCIWESWRNGHWQLFSATTPVVIGSVPDSASEGDLKVLAYPNPFEDILWLEYESGKTAHLTVTIFNTFGHLVKTIDEGYSSKEKMTKNIDMKDVPAGIYLVRIEAGNAVDFIKVVKK